MSGIAEVILSAFDFDRVAAALVGIGGYRRVDLPDASAAQAAAWHAPADCTRIEQALLLPAEGDRGRLRLVRFHGIEQALIRPSQRSWDTGGIFDVDIFSTDVTKVYAQLQRLGWSALGEPVRYTMGEFDVTQVVATGPDGLVLAIIQPHKSPSFELPITAMSRIFNSTQIVADMDRALDFYTRILGWTMLVNLTVEDCAEPGADVLGLPMPFAGEAKRRVAIVHPHGINDGSIELIEIVGWQGKDYGSRAIAPNVGLMALRIELEGIETHAEAIRVRGGELYTEPTRFEIPPFGETSFFSVRSPDGAIIEIHEARATPNA